MAAQAQQETALVPVEDSSVQDSVRDREISVEQEHLDRVYRRLEEKINEAEFLMHDAAKRGQVGTPGALAERDAQVFRAGIHLNRLNNEFEDFLFGRIDLLRGKDGKKGPDGAYTAVEPAEGAVRPDSTADIAETLHIGRIGVLDEDYSPLVIDWRAPAAAPFYRSTPVDPGRVVRRRVIRSKGRRVLGVEDDLMRPELKASLDGHELAGDRRRRPDGGARPGPQPHHAGHRVVHPGRTGPGDPGPRRLGDVRRGRPGHRQDGRRPAPRRLPALPGPPPVRGRHPDRLPDAPPGGVHGGRPALPRRGGPGRHPRHRLPRRRRRGHPVRLPGRGPRQGLVPHAQRCCGRPRGAPWSSTTRRRRRTACRVVVFGRRIELEAPELARIRESALSGTAPVNLLRPRARRLLLDALWARSGAQGRHTDPELAAELRSSFDEDVTTEDDFIAFLDAWWPELTPASVLAAMSDERRLGRWARRILNPGEVRRVARALKRDGLSVHDVAMLDELHAILGTPARPRKRRDLDPLDQLTGLEELMPVREESQRERAERLAQERTEYAHVIVDEAQDLTPMQWRMVGRRGRHATWTVVGDPAQSSWSDPDEAAEARDEALGSRPRRRFTLTVNYRNPAEIADLAAKVLALAMPGSESPRAVRSTGRGAPLRPPYGAPWPSRYGTRPPASWTSSTARSASSWP